MNYMEGAMAVKVIVLVEDVKLIIMSHYLNFYIKPKISEFDSEKEKSRKEAQEPVFLTYYCGSSDIYQLFRDNGLDHYMYDKDGKETYRELTLNDINTLKEDLNTSINRFKLRIKAINDMKSVGEDAIEEQYSNYTALADYQSQLKEVEFIENLYDRMCYLNTILINGD